MQETNNGSASMTEPSLFISPAESPFKWTATPYDIALAWERLVEVRETILDTFVSQIKAARQELSDLKGNREKWAMHNKRALNKEINSLQERIVRYNYAMESWYIEQTENFRHEIVEAAKLLGYEPEEDEEWLLQDEFLLTIFERPGIEWCWTLILADIHMRLVKKFMEAI